MQQVYIELLPYARHCFKHLKYIDNKIDQDSCPRWGMEGDLDSSENVRSKLEK